jgi:hypothetical protein
MSDTSEAKLFATFVLPTRRSRYVSLADTKSGRERIRAQLGHFSHFDPRFVRTIAPAGQNVKDIYRLLKGMGAGPTCYVLSESERWDTQTMSLEEALLDIVGSGLGTILDCVPGALAYYEGEEPGHRLILQRPHRIGARTGD